MSSPLASQDMPHAVWCNRLDPLQKCKKSLHTHDSASYTAKRHQLACWQASISVSWAVGGVCKVFACLLGSYLASFVRELRIAALREPINLNSNVDDCPTENLDINAHIPNLR